MINSKGERSNEGSTFIKKEKISTSWFSKLSAFLISALIFIFSGAPKWKWKNGTQNCSTSRQQCQQSLLRPAALLVLVEVEILPLASRLAVMLLWMVPPTLELLVAGVVDDLSRMILPRCPMDGLMRGAFLSDFSFDAIETKLLRKLLISYFHDVLYSCTPFPQSTRHPGGGGRGTLSRRKTDALLGDHDIHNDDLYKHKHHCNP